MLLVSKTVFTTLNNQQIKGKLLYYKRQEEEKTKQKMHLLFFE